jgi:hypothetical protein
LTIPDADILEDEVVTKAGTYVGSAPISPSGSWIMQMIALRAAKLASPTPTPVPTPSVMFTKWIALMNAEISSASPSSAELLQWINANPPAGN